MPIGTSIKTAVEWLQQGEPVALPTETVYGLAAPLGSVEAIQKIYTIKRRPANNPLIVHVLDINQLEKIAVVNASARVLCEKFWPGPLTLVLPKKDCVPDIVTAQQPSVAVRAPTQPLFREILKILKQPLVAPSANRFMQLSPTKAQHVWEGLGEEVKYILDGGSCTFGVESTIISLLSEEKPQLLRPGPISVENLSSALNRAVSFPKNREKESEAKLCPGLFKKHYSPQTTLVLFERLESVVLKSFDGRKIARIFFKKPNMGCEKNAFWLSEQGNLEEAAFRLFDLLQELDGQHWDELWIEKVPNQGIGQAINDRITRAAYQESSVGSGSASN